MFLCLILIIYIQTFLMTNFYIVEAISDNVIIKMPSFVQEGGDARLTCFFEHVLDDKPLYQLQWQFNGFEFYRFNGKNKYAPRLQQFSIPEAFEVDLDNSSEGSVSLKNMTSKATGRYSCEVSAEKNFHTFRADETLRVGSRNHGLRIGGWKGRNEYYLSMFFLERILILSLLIIFNSWIFNRTSQQYTKTIN